MSKQDYLDFDLMIEKTDSGYTARVLNSPAGPATHEFAPPFQDMQIENFILRMGQSRRGMRRMESPQMAAAKEFGNQLFQAVFDEEVGDCLHSSLAVADQQDKGLRIRLRLSDAQDLLNLPWEYLYNAQENRFLSLSISSPIVRYLDMSGRIEPLLVQPPLRVLVMISSPQGYPPLDVEREWSQLQASVGDLVDRGMVILDRLDVASLGELQRMLRDQDYHIFHFIGHGGYDEQDQDGVLVLEGEEGQARPVSGQYLGMMLRDERTIRLAVLNACEGGRTSATDPFAGVGQSLLQQGIPAVIAMQFEISDEAAVTMAHEFYLALAEGYPVDAALVEARKAIFARNNDVEWGTPVLYLRSNDGRIFDVDATALAMLAPTPDPTPVSGPPLPNSPATRRSASIPAAPILTKAMMPWIGVAAVAVLLVLAVIFWPRSGGQDVPAVVDGASQPAAVLPAVDTPTSQPIATIEVAPASTAVSAPQVDIATWINPVDGATYVLVPAGPFTMGASNSSWDEERPVHTVTLDAYWIQRTEVTNAQYGLCVSAGNCTAPNNGFWTESSYFQHPVMNVDWQQAQAYAKWVGGSLPTEAQWEKACRGTDQRTYPWGANSATSDLANYNGNLGSTTSVGSFSNGVSPFGLLDMAGNVWEWTADWHSPTYYRISPDSNPTGPDSGDFRVIRGGSFEDEGDWLRCANRPEAEPEDRTSPFGFRVVSSRK